MDKYYPIMIRIERKLCTVVGGGKVAERKIISLIDHGARVKVISPSCTNKISEFYHSGIIEFINREYEYGDLDGSFLAYITTDVKRVNDMCISECKEKEILVNIADNPEKCDFVVPSTIKRGDLTINISTMGKSPTLSKKIRKEIEEIYPEAYSEYVDILGEIREKVKEEIKDIKKRREIFYELVYSNVLEDYMSGKGSNIKDSIYSIYYKIANR